MFCLNDTMRYHFYSMTLDEFTQVFEAWQQERMYDIAPRGNKPGS